MLPDRPTWKSCSPYRTIPFPILPILPPLKRQLMPDYKRLRYKSTKKPVKIEVEPVKPVAIE